MRIAPVILFSYVAILAAAAQPATPTLMAEADELYETGRFEEALAKFEEAERADPAYDDFAWLERLSQYKLEDASPRLRDDRAAQRALDRRIGLAMARSARRHPERRDVFLAARQLAGAGDFGSGFALTGEIIKAAPRNVHALHGQMFLSFMRAKEHPAEAAAEAQRFVQTLDRTVVIARDPEALYFAGVYGYEFAAKINVAADAKMAVIRRAAAALDRAIDRNPEYMEALAYRSILLREEAKLATDPADAERLNAEAERLRAKTMEIMNKRRAQ